jgi:hypothetical protein
VKAEQEPSARDILMRMMKVFIIKFKSIAEYVIPDIFKRWYSKDQCQYL